MSIAFDAVTNFTFNFTITTMTYSHTCTGSNRILWVGASIRPARTIATGGVTYNGVAMTQSGAFITTGTIRHYLFFLINPASGSNTVSITQSAADTMTSCSISYTGARQSSQPDATNEGGPTTTTAYSQAVTSVANNSFAVLYGGAQNATGLTAGTNVTIRRVPETDFTGAFLLESTAAQTPAGTFTLAVTSASQVFAGCMASFSPIVSFTPSPDNRMYFM